jgi:hypothetical protein
MTFKAEATFNDRRVQKFLRDIDKNYKDAESKKKFYAFLGIEVFADIMDHFEKEEGPGGAWQERSQPYRDFIEGQGKTKILQVTGNLKKGFTPIKSGGNAKKVPEGILWENRQKTESGFPYAAAHDEGGPKLPQRSFMWLSQPRIEKMAELILKKMTGDK